MTGRRPVILRVVPASGTGRSSSHSRGVGHAEVVVGCEAGEGFIKLPDDRELPTELLKALMQAWIEEYETTCAG